MFKDGVYARRVALLRPLFPFVPAAPFLPLRLNYHSDAREASLEFPPSRTLAAFIFR